MVLAAVAMVGVAGCARPIQLTSQLSSTQEVPPTGSAGTGMFTGTYYPSTRALDYNLTYGGLTGPATAAHLHGPAMPGQNAGVVVPFTVTATPMPAPVSGSATLTDAQAADLMAGKWYANVHTMQNPNGEIRGQVIHN